MTLMVDRSPSDYNRSPRYNASMRRFSLVLPAALLLTACAAAPPPAARSSLYVFRLDRPALVELDSEDKPVREIPITIPEGCGLEDVSAPARGADLAIELSCPFGQAVAVVNTLTGALRQPVTDSDSHFLAWSANGGSLYLKVNSINRPQIVRIASGGPPIPLPISELTYDLAPAVDASGDFVFSLSAGMGLGSEMWLVQDGGSEKHEIAADPQSYLSLARWSPDGRQLAFIRIPDSPTPYTVGRLWVMQADGSGARSLADADAGHGFAPSWSPDGSQIALVHRENPTDANADESAQALISNLHVVNLADGSERSLTVFDRARVEAPLWQPDGSQLAFTVALDDKMQVYVLDVTSGVMQRVPIESACCAAWVRN